MATRPRSGIPQRPGMMLPMRIWDGPIRLFHWSLALLVGFCWLSMELYWIQAHMLAGQAVMALLIWRVVWGFVGSDTARFARFLASPLAALRHLAHFGRREPDTQVGHNEAGGWMVVAMLLLLAAQVAAGLFANDVESFISGPLAKLVTDETGGWALKQHKLIFQLIQIAVLLHVLAIVGYAVVKRHDLVRPMVTGKKRLPAATPAPRMGSPWLALGILVASAALVWAVTTRL